MTETEGSALTERQREWLKHIQACEASGKTVAEYAADHSLNAQAMYAGKKVLVGKGVLPCAHPARFQQVQVVNVPAVSDWRIQLPNGVSVAFSGAVDTRALSTVLTAAATVG